jgi:hypothetical protein
MRVDAAPGTAEASMNQVLRRANKARAGVFNKLIDALLEWLQQPGGGSRDPAASHRQFGYPPVSEYESRSFQLVGRHNCRASSRLISTPCFDLHNVPFHA